MSSHEPDRDGHLPSKAQVNPANLGDALADLPVPEHGPTFWAELDHRLQGAPVQKIESGELHLPPPGNPGPADPNPNPLPAETVSLEEERARRATRRGRGMNRYLGAAAAAVALILAVVGGHNVIQDDDGTDIRAA